MAAYQQGHTAESICVDSGTFVVYTEIDGMGSEWLGSAVDLRYNYVLLTWEHTTQLLLTWKSL